MANVVRNKTFTSPDFLAAAYFAVGYFPLSKLSFLATNGRHKIKRQ